MRTRKRRTLGFLAGLIAVLAFAAIFAAAAGAWDSGDKAPGTGQQTLTWTGNGWPAHQTCTPADPGNVGYQNGASASNYMLWILNTDGGSITGGWSLTVGGNTYSTADDHQLVTPFVDPTGAVANLDVADTGGGSWTLTVSHGCGSLTPPADDLTVTKDANGSYTNTFKWTIAKAADPTTVYTAGGVDGSSDYTVTVTHDTGTISDVTVSGTITVSNPNVDASENPVPVDIGGVTDQLSDGTVCTVTGGGPQTIDGSSATFDYSCSLSSLPTGSIDNTATVEWSDQMLDNGAALAAGSADFTVTDVPFTADTVDGCVTVDDTNPAGPQDVQVCTTDPSPKTFTYTGTVSGEAGTCTPNENTATIAEVTAGFAPLALTAELGSDSATVTDCQGADLTVEKTAVPSFTRTYTWGIDKSADPTTVDTAGGTDGTSSYTVHVTHDTGVDSGWQVEGKITVTNPNDWEGITADVADTIDNGGDCTVADGTGVVVPASDSVTLDYTCTYDSAPDPAAFTNTATATWDAATYSTPTGTASGTADEAFTDPTTIENGSVTAVDSVQGVLGTVSYTDPSRTTYTYQGTVTGDPGTCTVNTNTARVGLSTDGTVLDTVLDTASVDVTDCQGADLTVSKTADTSFTRAYTWSIAKAVDKTRVELSSSTLSATFNYTVDVNQTGFSDSGFGIAGKITITNPNDWEAITLTSLTDTLDQGGTCKLDPGPYVVPESGSLDVNYTCTSDGTTTKNTGTANWDNAAYSTPTGTAGKDATVAFTTPTTVKGQTITPTDAFNGGAGLNLCTLDSTQPCTLTAVDAAPFTSATYHYSRTIPAPGVPGCKSYTNTATIDTVPPQSSSKTVTVCNTSTPPLTPGYWKNHLTYDSKHPNDPYTQKFLTQYLNGYAVDTTAKATAVFNGMNCAFSSDQGAVGCLAGHLLAAKLNVANKADVVIQPTIDQGDAFLTSIKYTGPSGKYTLTAVQRTYVIGLVATLDKFNNGKGV